MWMEERGKQINENRVREAAGTGATLSVFMPSAQLCYRRRAEHGDELRVVDVATRLGSR